MARLLTGMWLLLLVSLSSMFLLMGNFLSERKHAAVSSPTPTPPPPALVPRNSAGEESAGLPTIEDVRPRGEPVGSEQPAVQQLSDDDVQAPPALALEPKTKQGKPLKSVSASATQSEAARPPIYSKNMKRGRLLERRRVGGRVGHRRLFR